VCPFRRTLPAPAAPESAPPTWESDVHHHLGSRSPGVPGSGPWCKRRSLPGEQGQGHPARLFAATVGRLSSNVVRKPVAAPGPLIQAPRRAAGLAPCRAARSPLPARGPSDDPAMPSLGPDTRCQGARVRMPPCCFASPRRPRAPDPRHRHPRTIRYDVGGRALPVPPPKADARFGLRCGHTGSVRGPWRKTTPSPDRGPSAGERERPPDSAGPPTPDPLPGPAPMSSPTRQLEPGAQERNPVVPAARERRKAADQLEQARGGGPSRWGTDSFGNLVAEAARSEVNC